MALGLRITLSVLWLLTVLADSGMAATRAEERDFRAAVGAFQIEQWARAESELGRFVELYPESSLVPEAVLLRAQAKFQQNKLKEAIALLQAHRANAGEFAERYLYWIGEAHFQLGEYAIAAERFSELGRSGANAPRRLEASVGEAAARARLGQWAQVTAILSTPDGAFQQAARNRPESTWVTRGLLLLAEAELAQGRTAAAQAALAPMENRWLEPEQRWQRQQLLVRIALAGGKTEEALSASRELDALANAAARSDFVAESAALEALVFERAGRMDDAMVALRRNLAAETPVERQREALAKIVDLALAQQQTEVAEDALGKFLARFPDSPAADLALLTVGELHLKRRLEGLTTNAPAADSAIVVTNHLERALSAFDRLLATSPDSSYLGRAQLNRGWCLTLSQQWAASQAAFAAAESHLPPSVDRAVAQLKLGDAHLLQMQFAEAKEAYRRALATVEQVPAAAPVIQDFALYQLVRACLGAGDVPGAEKAMQALLDLSPQRELAERLMLQVAQGYADVFEPAQALALYEQFLAVSPTNSLRPRVELAAARAQEQLGDWSGALGRYEHWLEMFPTNALRPEAEFFRAMAGVRSGQLTNAADLLTSFVTTFPQHPLVPMAEWWLGQDYFGRGNFPEAERHFKLLFQNWPQSELAYQARMMAGRAATGRLDPLAAVNYFTNLTSDLKNCPPGVRLEALFAYGDTLMNLTPSGTNRLNHLAQALEVYATIQRENAGTEAAARALGQIGNCYLQMAAQDGSFYPAATNAYQQVLEASAAGAGVRSQAQVGLARVLEKLAADGSEAVRRDLLTAALNHFLDVVLEKNLRPGESPDAFWVKVAGLEAARLMETLGEWSQAEKLYERLKELLPPLTPSLDRRISAVREQRSRKPDAGSSP